jgi:4-amino-4-deoxy-L-arabinose transferase-like glycosyltransferase
MIDQEHSGNAMKSPMRALILLLLLAQFALALQYSFRNPLGEAPDEADHWAYVVQLATARTLPVGPTLTQAKHPPLYYMGAALFAALDEPAIDFFRPNPAVNLASGAGYSPNFFQHGAVETPPWEGPLRAYHLARLWSVLLGTLTLAATATLARVALPRLPLLPIVAVALLGFMPEFLFLSGSVTNDMGAACWGALALWGGLRIYRSGGRMQGAWWTSLALAAGFLSKASSVALWPVVAAAIALGALTVAPRGQRWAWITWRRMIATGIAIFLPALLLVLPWLLRNLRLYGDVMGMRMARQTIDQRTTPWTGADTLWLLRGWFISFWGKFGGAGHIAMAGWLYGVLAALTLLALLGLLLLWLRSGWQAARWPLLLLAGAAGAVALAMARYSLIALGTDQGRLLYPAAAAIAILLAAGWLEAGNRLRRARVVAGIIVVAAAALGIYGLWGVIVPVLGST